MVPIKRAQIEMIGLVIIVLLIVIIAVFALRFMITKEEDPKGKAGGIITMSVVHGEQDRARDIMVFLRSCISANSKQSHNGF